MSKHTPLDDMPSMESQRPTTHERMVHLEAINRDLLGALKDAEAFVVGCDGAQMIWEQIRAAIRKAEEG